MPSTVIFLTSPTGSNQTWRVPEDWNNSANTIYAFGAGGSGAAALDTTAASSAATGGGGGGFASISNLSLTPDTNVTYQVGAGGAAVTQNTGGVGTGNNGGSTWFNGTTLGGSSVGAVGGTGGVGTTGSSPSLTGSAGGAGSSGVGSSTASGGAGGNVSVSGITTAASGGGGAGGSHGAGNSAATVTSIGNGLGASGDAGSGGAGGSSNGASGSAGAEYTSNPGGATAGPGGGGAGVAAAGSSGTWTGGSGGNYGAGGGGSAVSDTGAVAVSGAGSPGLIVIVYTPLPIQTGAQLAGTGSLTAKATQIQQAGAAFAGAGGLAVPARQIQQAGAHFAGSGGLTVSLPELLVAGAAFAGTGALLNAIASKIVTVTSQAMAGSGGLSVHAEVLNAASFHGSGSMSVDAQYVPRPITVSTADQHVRRTADDYTHGLADLLPTGPAWPRDPADVLWTALGGLMGIFGYFDGRAADLLEIESDPRSTVELLPDWERNFGLPDDCAATEQLSIADRQTALVQKMTTIGGQSRAFFIEAAARIGYTITISEYSPFMVGVSQVGDTRDAQGDYRWQLGPVTIRFYWTVHVADARLTWFRCGGGGGQCGVDPMLIIGLATDLECLLRRWKPGHTEIVFDYSNLESGGAFAGTP